MRPIDLKHLTKRTHPFGRLRHPFGRNRSAPIPRDVLHHLLKASSWRAHPAPFAKTRRGGERRVERRFIASRKCGFGCP
jgi:hypothetical protein